MTQKQAINISTFPLTPERQTDRRTDRATMRQLSYFHQKQVLTNYQRGLHLAETKQGPGQRSGKDVSEDSNYSPGKFEGKIETKPTEKETT